MMKMNSISTTLLIIFAIIVFRLPFASSMDMEKFRPIKADIVLAIDTAVGGVGRSPDLLEVEVIQHFLRKITMAFPLTTKESRMAVVEFGVSARVRVPLSEGVDQRMLYSVYDDLSEWYDENNVDRKGQANYESMFRRVYEEIFNGREGDRPEIPNLLMVLTIVPSFPHEDPVRWRLRAQTAARGIPYGFPDPDGVIITTGYATLRGTHIPKFTLTRGVGAFAPNAWFYQDFKDIIPDAIVHLRHAMRSAWVDHFYSERQLRGIRVFDYSTCRDDPILMYKAPMSMQQKAALKADVVFAIEMDGSVSSSSRDALRTYVLNISRYLPVEKSSIRFWPVEFNRKATLRIVAREEHGSMRTCDNQTSLKLAMIENWVPLGGGASRPFNTTGNRFHVEGAGGSGTLMNLHAMAKTIQEALNSTARIPQVIFATIVFPEPSSTTTLDAWYHRFLKTHGPSLKKGVDALIVTSGSIPNTSHVFTKAVSPLLPGGASLDMVTVGFEEAVRNHLFDVVINVTKAAVIRCQRCYYNAKRQCVVDTRPSVINASEIEFIDGRYCQRASGGVALCATPITCAIECERRPWGEWGMCWSSNFARLIKGKGLSVLRRQPLNKADSNGIYLRYCPNRKKMCKVELPRVYWVIFVIIMIGTFFLPLD